MNEAQSAWALLTLILLLTGAILIVLDKTVFGGIFTTVGLFGYLLLAGMIASDARNS